VGFLFPHRCERVTPEGCPDCKNGQIQDPYRSRRDRRGYDDDYDTDVFAVDDTDSGVGGTPMPLFGGGDSGGGGASLDFTEADGASLVNPDEGFEDDLSAS
jgi:hypothetical protein